jgi:hypothetical protein
MGPFIPPSLRRNLPGTSQAGFPRPSAIALDPELGNYIGQRAAGLTAAGVGTSGSHQFAHAGHYGKLNDPGLKACKHVAKPGPLAFEAAQRLKHTEDWKIILAALSEQMGRLAHSAIETGLPDHCGYARGVRDTLWALEVMEAGIDARRAPREAGHQVEVFPQATA